jgi:hypothetical protein
VNGYLFFNPNPLCHHAAYAFEDAVHTFSMIIFLKGLSPYSAGTPMAWYYPGNLNWPLGILFRARLLDG